MEAPLLGREVERAFPFHPVEFVVFVGINHGFYEALKVADTPRGDRCVDVDGHTTFSQVFDVVEPMVVDGGYTIF
jgi:hypothetical protein